MLTNAWVKTYSDEDIDVPDEDGEHGYYFGSKGKIQTAKSGKEYDIENDGINRGNVLKRTGRLVAFK